MDKRYQEKRDNWLKKNVTNEGGSESEDTGMRGEQEDLVDGICIKGRI